MLQNKCSLFDAFFWDFYIFKKAALNVVKTFGPGGFFIQLNKLKYVSHLGLRTLYT